MSDIIILEALQTFLRDTVVSQIKLQKPNDKNVLSYELVNPAVHIGWIPPKGYIPEGMESAIPAIVVGYDNAYDDDQEAKMNVRLSFAVFSPGKHELQEDGSIKFTPGFDGYRDLLNFIEKTKQELIRQRIVGGITAVEPPFKRGMYQDQLYPYWYGWLTFTATLQSGLYVPSISQQYL